jgi:hypothetical protein
MSARNIAPVLIVTAVLFTLARLAGATPSVDRFTGVEWQWAGTTRPDGSASTPPDPAAYTITFGSDRTYSAQADCNAVAGTYRRVPPGRMGPLTRLQMAPGPATLAACDPGSLSDTFIADLRRAALYVISDDMLRITLADGGSMTFR